MYIYIAVCVCVNITMCIHVCVYMYICILMYLAVRRGPVVSPGSKLEECRVDMTQCPVPQRLYTKGVLYCTNYKHRHVCYIYILYIYVYLCVRPYGRTDNWQTHRNSRLISRRPFKVHENRYTKLGSLSETSQRICQTHFIPFHLI